MGPNKKTYIGEAYFLRGFNYLKLVSQYGGVPLKLSPSVTPEREFTRATTEGTLAQVISDLTKAYNNLPEKASMIGKMTKDAAAHFLECLSKYEVYPQIGLTLIRNEENGEETETVLFEGRDSFTSDISLFLKKLKGTKLYGGGDDGKESVHKAIGTSLRKFPVSGRNKAIMVFTDAYGSNDYEEYTQYPVGQVIFFSTDEMSEEDFHFCFVKPDGELDEEASPMFIKIDKLLKPMSTEFLDNIVKPLKDLMKGVSIGA